MFISHFLLRTQISELRFLRIRPALYPCATAILRGVKHKIIVVLLLGGNLVTALAMWRPAGDIIESSGNLWANMHRIIRIAIRRRYWIAKKHYGAPAVETIMIKCNSHFLFLSKKSKLALNPSCFFSSCGIFGGFCSLDFGNYFRVGLVEFI